MFVGTEQSNSVAHFESYEDETIPIESDPRDFEVLVDTGKHNSKFHTRTDREVPNWE